MGKSSFPVHREIDPKSLSLFSFPYSIFIYETINPAIAGNQKGQIMSIQETLQYIHTRRDGINEWGTI